MNLSKKWIIHDPIKGTFLDVDMKWQDKASAAFHFVTEQNAVDALSVKLQHDQIDRQSIGNMFLIEPVWAPKQSKLKRTIQI